MTQPAYRHATFDEYLRLEAFSNIKHEFVDGLILAMAGGTPEHAALAAAVIGLLFQRLQGGRCRVYDSDLRVGVQATGLTTYPDVTVICGPRRSDPRDPNTVVNPTLLVEVLSPSTEEYDRGDKREHYQRIESLQEVLLVASERRRLETWRRGPDATWTMHASGAGEHAELTSVGCRIGVDEIYDAAADPAG
ncbi:MAG: Uma2 family endonuclease [Polyangiaceae bacterium]